MNVVHELERARADLTRAQWKRDDAIRAASEAGLTLRQIALHTGLSHAGVAKVLARSTTPIERVDR